LKNQGNIILFKDTENDVYFVMAALMRFVGHDSIQAEQCALIASNKGRCLIKTGSQTEILEIYTNLKDMGLKVRQNNLKNSK
jgi:hypothetical protein